MSNYITGETVRLLRERKKFTQKQLADKLCVSDKTISKWETGKGLPDISLLEPLATALGVSLSALFTGNMAENRNVSANLMRSKFYVCPVCGNLITAVGEGDYHCCGISLPPLTAEDCDEEHQITVDRVEDEFFVHMHHPMFKDHYISFISCVNDSRIQTVKLYAEQDPETRIKIAGSGLLYCYCNRHGLFRIKI